MARLRSNRTGRISIVLYFLLALCFVIVWALGLGAWISQAGQIAVDSAGLTGIEAFILGNLNLVIFLSLFIASAGVIGFGVIGGSD